MSWNPKRDRRYPDLQRPNLGEWITREAIKDYIHAAFPVNLSDEHAERLLYILDRQDSWHGHVMEHLLRRFLEVTFWRFNEIKIRIRYLAWAYRHAADFVFATYPHETPNPSHHHLLDQKTLWKEIEKEQNEEDSDEEDGAGVEEKDEEEEEDIKGKEDKAEKEEKKQNEGQPDKNDEDDENEDTVHIDESRAIGKPSANDKEGAASSSSSSSGDESDDDDDSLWTSTSTCDEAMEDLDYWTCEECENVCRDGGVREIEVSCSGVNDWTLCGKCSGRDPGTCDICGEGDGSSARYLNNYFGPVAGLDQWATDDHYDQVENCVEGNGVTHASICGECWENHSAGFEFDPQAMMLHSCNSVGCQPALTFDENRGIKREHMLQLAEYGYHEYGIYGRIYSYDMWGVRYGNDWEGNFAKTVKCYLDAYFVREIRDFVFVNQCFQLTVPLPATFDPYDEEDEEYDEETSKREDDEDDVESSNRENEDDEDETNKKDNNKKEVATETNEEINLEVVREEVSNDEGNAHAFVSVSSDGQQNKEGKLSNEHDDNEQNAGNWKRKRNDQDDTCSLQS